MKVINSPLPDVKIIEPTLWEDKRGFFYESFNSEALEEAGISRNWVQDNHSCSAAGVLRGLHYQLTHPQAKLVRVVRGRAYDVAVDIRRGSPSFGRWFGLELSEANKRIIFIPEGFAHGFYALEEKTEIVYKCSDRYHPPGERGIIWNDPELDISWPLLDNEPNISEKDLDATWLSRTDPVELPIYSN
jgi:dTDP-4-dehydrorhamnose 3,5-epimerase